MVNGHANARFQLDLFIKRNHYMKCWMISIMMVLGSLQLFSQQEYFIYVQSNNQQPFYLRTGTTTYNASTGFLIISKLPDSICSMAISFPGSNSPEQEFSIPVNKKDAGYNLVNNTDKEWAMVNLQSQAVISAVNADQQKKKHELTGIKRTDAFSVLLSNAVNDSSVLYTIARNKKVVPVIADVAKKEEAKIDSGSITNENKMLKDSVAFVKNKPQQKTKASAVKNRPGKNATVLTTKKNEVNSDSAKTAVKKDSIAIVQQKKPSNADSIAIAKNSRYTNKQTGTQKGKQNPAADSINMVKNSAAKSDSSLTKRKILIKKDTVAIAKNDPVKNKTKVASTKKKYTEAELDAIIKRNIAVADSIMNARKKSNSGKDSIEIAKNNAEKLFDTVAVSAIPENQKEINAIKNDPDKTDSVITSKNPREPNNKKPAVTKAAEILTDTSYIAVFVDQSNEKFDTIRISIPFNEAAVVKKETIEPEKEIKHNDSGIAQSNVDTGHKPDTINKFEPIVKKDSSVINSTDTQTTAVKPRPVMTNSDCKNMAWDSDIDKLRIKMMLLNSTEEKILLARKIYTQKCFTVKQVRALSELFKTDESKYKWCDAVYSFVTDSNNFSSLADLFKEEYYLNRFKAMLRN